MASRRDGRCPEPLRAAGDIPEIYTKTITPDLTVTDDAIIAGSGNRDGIAPDQYLIIATSGTMTEPKLVALTATSVDLTVSAIAAT